MTEDTNKIELLDWEKKFICEDCEWKYINVNLDGEIEELPVPITLVPTEALLKEWENLIQELAMKKDALNKTTLEYKEKSFDIKYIADIDFKKLYGKANDDVRKYHAEKECKDLIQHKEHLEISIKFLEQYLHLMNSVVYYSQKGRYK